MGINLYPSFILNGDDSTEFGSDIDQLCEDIHEACKGFGTDEKALLMAVGKLTPDARCKVPIRYKDMFGKDLKDVIDRECGDKPFGTALQFLSVNPVQAECDMIHKACKGAGTNEKLLYTIISGRSNKEMVILKREFFDRYNQDVAVILTEELGGEFEQFIVNSLQADEKEYDSDYHNSEQAEEDVEKLYKMGQGNWFGTDETGLFKLLCSYPPEYLKTLNAKYEEKHGKTLAEAMDREMGGKLDNAVMHLLNINLNPYETIAKVLKEACQGFGTNELLLAASLIRYQNVFSDVDRAHEQLYNKSLEDRVQAELSGDYQDLLVEVIKHAKHS